RTTMNYLNYYFVVSGLLLAMTAQADNVKDKMHALAQQSQASKASCDQFSKNAKSTLGTEASEKPWKWDERTEKLLALAESYPGTPQASKEGYQLFRATPNAPSVFEQSDVTSLASCSIIDFFDVSKKLIASLPGFPKDKQNKVVGVLV